MISSVIAKYFMFFGVEYVSNFHGTLPGDSTTEKRFVPLAEQEVSIDGENNDIGGILPLENHWCKPEGYRTLLVNIIYEMIINAVAATDVEEIFL